MNCDRTNKIESDNEIEVEVQLGEVLIDRIFQSQTNSYTFNVFFLPQTERHLLEGGLAHANLTSSTVHFVEARSMFEFTIPAEHILQASDSIQQVLHQ